MQAQQSRFSARTAAHRPCAAAAAAAVHRRWCSAAASSNGAGTSTAEPTLRVPDWPGGVFSLRMEVRDTELDQFQVVNNNVYGAYMQHGRHKALEAMGAGVGDYQARGVLMALSELVVRFKAPLRSGDAFRVETSVEQVTAARLVMKHAVVREGSGGASSSGNGAASSSGKGAASSDGGKEAVCAEGTATVVFLDPQYRPIRLPAADREVFAALAAQRQAAADSSSSSSGS